VCVHPSLVDWADLFVNVDVNGTPPLKSAPVFTPFCNHVGMRVRIYGFVGSPGRAREEGIVCLGCGKWRFEKAIGVRRVARQRPGFLTASFRPTLPEHRTTSRNKLPLPKSCVYACVR